MLLKSVIRHVNILIEKTKEDYPDIDETILKACIVYQYLYIKHFKKFITVKEILDLNNQEIGLIGYGNNCLSHLMQRLFGWIDTLRTHAILHDAYGRFYCKYECDRGYCYSLNESPEWMKGSPFCGQISGILYCIGKQLSI